MKKINTKSKKIVKAPDGIRVPDLRQPAATTNIVKPDLRKPIKVYPSMRADARSNAQQDRDKQYSEDVNNPKTTVGDVLKTPLISLAHPIDAITGNNKDRIREARMNDYNPNTSTGDKLKGSIAQGLSYVPEAAMNLSMAVAPSSKGIKLGIDAVKQGEVLPYQFAANPDSYYRGIGVTDAGVKDLVQSGIARGNPQGRYLAPSQATSLYKKAKFKALPKDVQDRYMSTALTDEDIKLIREIDPVMPKAEVTSFGKFDLDKGMRGQTSIPIDKNIAYNEAYYFKGGLPPRIEESNVFPSKYYIEAKSKDMSIPEGHYHPTPKTPVTFAEPTTKVYEQKSKFGIKYAKQLNKDKLAEQYGNFATGGRINTEPMKKMMKPTKAMIKDMMLKKTKGIAKMDEGGRMDPLALLAPKGVTNTIGLKTPTSSLGLSGSTRAMTSSAKPGLGFDPISMGLQAGKMISDAIPVDEYGVAKTGVAAGLKAGLDPIGGITKGIAELASGKANIGDMLGMMPGVGGIVAAINNKALAKKRDAQIAQQKIAANTQQYQSDLNASASQDANYLNGRGQGFDYNSMFDAPNGIRLDTSVDTTGFAKRSKDLLLSNVHQTPGGFIGNKRNTDLAQSSTAVTRSLGVGTKGIDDGTPVPWYVKPTDQGFVMKSLGDPNTTVNLGTDKAFAEYVSTLGVTEANKLKNPQAYEQAKKEFVKRVNIKPNNDMSKLAQGGRIALPNEMKPQGQMITAPNGSTAPMHGQPGGDIPIQNAQGQTMVNAEPGEILANLPDDTGKDVPTVLSKRLGYAQEFQALQGQKSAITAKILSSKDRELKAKLSLQLRDINAKIDELGLKQDQENGNKEVDAQGNVSQDTPESASNMPDQVKAPWGIQGDGNSPWGVTKPINYVASMNTSPRGNIKPSITYKKPIKSTNSTSLLDTTPIDLNSVITQGSINPIESINKVNPITLPANPTTMSIGLQSEDTSVIPTIKTPGKGINLKGEGNFLNNNSDTINKGLSFAAPLVANAMTNKYAKDAYNKVNDLIAPVYKSTPIDTRVDTSAAINALNQGANQAMRNTTQAFSDPTVAQAYASKIGLDRNAMIPGITAQATQQSNQLKQYNASAADRAGQMSTEAASTLAQLKAQAFGELQGVKSSTGQAAAQSLLNLIKEGNTNKMNEDVLKAIYGSMDSTGGINFKNLPKWLQDKIGSVPTSK